LPIVFLDEAKDQKIFKSMFDAFYKDVLSWGEYGNNLNTTECKDLINKVLSYPSPIQGWLAISPAEIKGCEAYKKLSDSFSTYQENFKNLMSTKMSTPFVFIMEGSEGGSGDIDFLPSIPLLPQLEVTPKKAKSK
jgi:hypothetical protein